MQEGDGRRCCETYGSVEKHLKLSTFSLNLKPTTRLSWKTHPHSNNPLINGSKIQLIIADQIEASVSFFFARWIFNSRFHSIITFYLSVFDVFVIILLVLYDFSLIKCSDLLYFSIKYIIKTCEHDKNVRTVWITMKEWNDRESENSNTKEVKEKWGLKVGSLF